MLTYLIADAADLNASIGPAAPPIGRVGPDCVVHKDVVRTQTGNSIIAISGDYIVPNDVVVGGFGGNVDGIAGHVGVVAREEGGTWIDTRWCGGGGVGRVGHGGVGHGCW